MKNKFQSKSVPRGTRTIWRYLSAFILLFSLSIGQMWAATETTPSSNGTNNADLVGTSYTIPGACNPKGTNAVGTYTGVKMRTNQAATVNGESVSNCWYMNINSGYKITAATFYMTYNSSAETIKNIYVDDALYSSPDEALAAKGGTPNVFAITGINATKQIVFEGTNAQQIFLYATFTYEATGGGGSTTTYSITYNCDGATSGCPDNVASATALPSTLPTLVKTGNNFGGWFTDSEKTVKAVAGAALSADANLYAKWYPVGLPLTAFSKGTVNLGTTQWSVTTKNATIYEDNNRIMLYSQGNALNVNANYLQIGNSSKASALVFRVAEACDLEVTVGYNGTDATMALYYLGTTTDELATSNFATGTLCDTKEVTSSSGDKTLVKQNAAAGYYQVHGSVRFLAKSITIADPTSTCTDPVTDATFAADDTEIEIAYGDANVSTNLTFTKGSNTSNPTYVVTKGGSATSDASVAGTTFTATKAGTYKVTATQAADGTYCEVVKEVTITVTEEAAPAPTCDGVGTIYSFKLKTDLTNGNVYSSTTGNDGAEWNTSNFLQSLTGGTLKGKITGSFSQMQFYDKNAVGFTGGTNGSLIITTTCDIEAGYILKINNTAAAGNKFTVSYKSGGSNKSATVDGGLQKVVLEAVDNNTITISRNSSTPKLTEVSIFVPYTITLAAGEGASVTPTSIKAEANEVVALPHPVKDGSLFTGWYDGETKVSDAYTVTKDVTLTAHYGDCPEIGSVYKFEVKTGLDNGSVAAANVAVDFTKVNFLSALDGGTLTTAGSKTNYVKIANKNSISLEDNGAYLKVDLDCALEAGDYFKTTITNNTLAVTKGNSRSTDNTIDAGTLVETNVPDALVGEKTLYLWRGGGNAAVSYFEIVRPVKKTVTFNMNGHGTQIPAVKVVTGGKVSAPTAPTAEGYRFVEWQLSGSTYNFDNEVTTDIQLDAVWQQTVTVSFVPGNGDANFSKTTDKGAVLAVADRPADPEYAGHVFLGWTANLSDDPMVMVDFALDVFAKNVTLYAAWREKEDDPSLSALAYDGHAIELSSGVDQEGVLTFAYELPYKAVYAKGKLVPTAAAASATISDITYTEGTKTATFRVTSQDGPYKDYAVVFTNGAKQPLCLIKATVTDNNTLVIDTEASFFEGTPSINAVTGNAETYEGKTAPKFQSNGYLGVNLTTESASFAAGDIVKVFATKAVDNGGKKLYVYSNNSGTSDKQIAESTEDLAKGYNEAALTKAATAVYLCRAGQYTSWNPCIYDITVYRAYPVPVLEAISFNGIAAVKGEGNTFSVKLPANADVDNLTVIEKVMSNDPENTHGAIQGAWALGDNTYRVTDAEGDYADYTISVAQAAAIDHVVISGTLSVNETENTTLTAVVYDVNSEVAEIQDVTWSTANAEIATVVAGVVTGVAPGSVEITATSAADNTKKATVTVSVTELACRTWSNPASKETGSTLGKLVITPVIGTLQENMTPYQGASATNAWKLDSKDSRYAEISYSDKAQIESLIVGVSSNDNSKNYKFAVVCSSAAGEGFAAGFLSAATYEAVDKDEAENLVDVELPVGTKAVRVYRQYTNDFGGEKSVYLYYINACKKEFVPVTAVSVSDANLAIGASITLTATSTPANADIASFTWSIVLPMTATGVSLEGNVLTAAANATEGNVVVKVVAKDVLNNEVEATATIHVVNHFDAITPVTETTTWSWETLTVPSGDGPKIAANDTVLANYLSGAEWEKIAGKYNEYVWRRNDYKCYQGTKLNIVTTVPGVLTVKARRQDSGDKLYVNGDKIADLTTDQLNYSVAVPAGEVKITGTAGMRIYAMTFKTLDEVATPDYSRTVTIDRMGTICVDHNVPAGCFIGAEVYKLLYWKYGTSYADCQMVDFEQVDEMEAGNPYLIIPTADELKLYYGAVVDETPNTVNHFIGTYNAIAQGEEGDAILMGKYGIVNNQIRLLGAGAYSPANRAFIDLENLPSKEEYEAAQTPNPAPKRRISLSRQGTAVATGLDAISVETEKVQKVMIDGQMYIIRNGHVFTVSGNLVK